MKIGDIEVGKNYGAVDEPSKRYLSTNPRKVEVIEIVTVEEHYWTDGSYKRTQTKRNVRRVKIKLLDEPTPKRGYHHYRDKIATLDKDSEIVVEARQLVGLWADLSPAIQARIRGQQASAEAKANAERVLREAGFGKMLDVYDVRISSYDGGKRLTVEFRDAAAVLLLVLLLDKLAMT